MLVLKITEQLTPEEKYLGVMKIAPVWGEQMSAESYFPTIARRLNHGLKPLSPAELGCSQAHISAYHRLIEQGSPGLIVEEDISITATMLESVKQLADKPINFIHLAECTWHRFNGSKIGPRLWKIDPRQGFFGAAAYYISIHTAKHLVEFHEQMPRVADDWAAFFRSYNIQPLYSPVFFHSGATSRMEGRRGRDQTISGKSFLINRARDALLRKLPRVPRGAKPIPTVLAEQYIDSTSHDEPFPNAYTYK